MASLRGLIGQQTGAERCVLAAYALTIVIGGGGIGFPLYEMALQLAILVLAGVWLWKSDRLRAILWQTWVVAALIVLIPALQLVPLPPTIWQGFPNRQPVIDALALVGHEHEWRPLSVQPDLTLGSLLSMVCSALLMIMVASLGPAGRAVIFVITVCVGLLSVAYGIGQVINGVYSAIEIYPPGTARLRGFLNNPNAQADFLLFAMVCVAAMLRDFANFRIIRDSRLRVISMVVVINAPLLLGVILTGSRTAMAMIPFVIAAQAALIRPWLKIGWRNLAIGSVLLPSILIGTYFALPDAAPVRAAIDRFELGADLRPQIWTDSRYNADLYKPVGSGMGTFVPVFMANERLEVLSELYINRAHDDYLEFLIEAGYVGYAAGAIILLLLGTRSVKGLHVSGGKGRGQIFCAIMALAIIGAHSFVDYPLRYMALAGVAAACAAMVLNLSSGGPRMGKRKSAYEAS